MLKAFKSTAAALVMVGAVGLVAAPAMAKTAAKPAATKTMQHKATKKAWHGKKMAPKKAMMKPMAKKGAMKKK